MSRSRMPGGLVVAGRRVLFRLLAARHVVRPLRDTPEVEPDAEGSLTKADPDSDGLDTVAGSEYVDDRIRFRE